MVVDVQNKQLSKHDTQQVCTYMMNLGLKKVYLRFLVRKPRSSARLKSDIAYMQVRTVIYSIHCPHC